MKLIIASGRKFTDYELLKSVMDSAVDKSKVDEVVCGLAKGADTLGKMWAEENNIHLAEFPADWNTYGRSAGPKRNCQMGDYADALIAFWDGESKGTKHMIDYMNSLNKPVQIYRYK